MRPNRAERVNIIHSRWAQTQLQIKVAQCVNRSLSANIFFIPTFINNSPKWPQYVFEVRPPKCLSLDKENIVVVVKFEKYQHINTLLTCCRIAGSKQIIHPRWAFLCYSQLPGFYSTFATTTVITRLRQLSQDPLKIFTVVTLYSLLNCSCSWNISVCFVLDLVLHFMVWDIAFTHL